MPGDDLHHERIVAEMARDIAQQEDERFLRMVNDRQSEMERMTNQFIDAVASTYGVPRDLLLGNPRRDPNRDAVVDDRGAVIVDGLRAMQHEQVVDEIRRWRRDPLHVPILPTNEMGGHVMHVPEGMRLNFQEWYTFEGPPLRYYVSGREEAHATISKVTFPEPEPVENFKAGRVIDLDEG